MRLIAVFGLVCCTTACVILPKEKTTAVPVGEKVGVWVPERPSTPDVAVMSIGTSITVRALAPRQCTRERYEIRDVTRKQHATFDLWAPADAPSVVGAVVLLASVFTLPVTGLITAVTIAQDKPNTTRETVHVPDERTPCPLLASKYRLTASFPNGAVVALETDEGGLATFAFPDSEPAVGTFVIRGGVKPRAIAYDRSAPEWSINADPVPVVPMMNRSATPLSSSVNQPPTATPDKAACQSERSRQMLLAQQLADTKQRTAALLALPVCPQ